MRVLITALPIPVLLLCASMSPASHAQARTPSATRWSSRPFQAGASRQLENYRFLEEAGKRTDPFDNLRYHRLGDSAWLQLGGELRYAFTYADNVAYDMAGQGDDNYIQQRAQAHASLHLWDNRIRTFVQLQNTRSWNQHSPLPRDESRNDIAQAFIDAHFTLGPLQSTARVGRQEVQYGQGALLNIGEQPNVRQAFDGAILKFRTLGNHQLDLLALRPISYDTDNFDDRSDDNTLLLGVYASLALTPQRGVDFYGITRDMDERLFQGFNGKEERHTLGSPVRQAPATGLELGPDVAGRRACKPGYPRLGLAAITATLSTHPAGCASACIWMWPAAATRCPPRPAGPSMRSTRGMGHTARPT